MAESELDDSENEKKIIIKTLNTDENLRQQEFFNIEDEYSDIIHYKIKKIILEMIQNEKRKFRLKYNKFFIESSKSFICGELKEGIKRVLRTYKEKMEALTDIHSGLASVMECY
ncbi:hypothetical protein AYI69_g8186 [Smittium culicis]|uniref:Uncharacterized protein n=1 Tax=Smittium culicis TaxID=133412 RepID=A0A1R1XLI9_9FUNG|nr:hypothetical protein AYI69_g8186 [Smittium culicis]